MRDLYPAIWVQPTEILGQTTLKGWKFPTQIAGYSISLPELPIEQNRDSRVWDIDL